MTTSRPVFGERPKLISDDWPSHPIDYEARAAKARRHLRILDHLEVVLDGDLERFDETDPGPETELENDLMSVLLATISRDDIDYWREFFKTLLPQPTNSG
jgi:hypothetical protein